MKIYQVFKLQELFANVGDKYFTKKKKILDF